MTFPADLPGLIEYRLQFSVLTALPRRPVEFVSTSGKTTAPIVRPRIPIGADAWRIPGGEWKPLLELPKSWMPFLQRQRGTFMDPRPEKFLESVECRGEGDDA